MKSVQYLVRRRIHLKTKRILFLLILTTVLVLLYYFVFPTKVFSVISDTANINRVHATYASNDQFITYLVDEVNKEELDELISILDSVSYNRGVRKFKGASGKVIMLNLVTKEREDGNIDFIYIHETGSIIVNNKEYRIYGDAMELVEGLYNWIKEYGRLISGGEEINLLGYS